MLLMKERVREILPTVVAILFWFGIGVLLYKCNNGKTKSYDTRVDDYPLPDECKFKDGVHSATVEYYNPETGHSASYDLEVDVEDCQVTTIYFPKGGWLDDSHINPSQLDDGGDASLEDDKGRRFDVHIED